jgi:hypothetical protein
VRACGAKLGRGGYRTRRLRDADVLVRACGAKLTRGQI